jgi:hypothetical protein
MVLDVGSVRLRITPEVSIPYRSNSLVTKSLARDEIAKQVPADLADNRNAAPQTAQIYRRIGGAAPHAQQKPVRRLQFARVGK